MKQTKKITRREKNEEITKYWMIFYIEKNGPAPKDTIHRFMQNVFTHRTRWSHISSILKRTDWKPRTKITKEMLLNA